ncbi:MAG: rhodanese-like domain-containing protein [Candidatus Nanopelagicales bacterium]
MNVETASDVLVDTDWLADRLQQPNVVAVEVVVSPAQYNEGHIPGAVLWDVHADLKDADYKLVDKAAVEQILSRGGIDGDTVIVVCGYAAALAGANGVTDFTTRTVTVRADTSAAQAVKTLAHELGHVLLHAPADGARPACRGIVEVEAESVAYLMTTSHGMDTAGYSFAYIASWAHAAPDPGWADAVGACGIDPSAAARFGIGWAPQGWTGLLDYLRAAGHSDAVIQAGGLARPARTGRLIDALRSRITFPYTDPGGQVVGFTALTAKDTTRLENPQGQPPPPHPPPLDPACSRPTPPVGSLAVVEACR